MVPHRLYGSVRRAEPWSSGNGSAAAERDRASVEEGRYRSSRGGTGLYFKALEDGLADIPAIPPR